MIFFCSSEKWGKCDTKQATLNKNSVAYSGKSDTSTNSANFM